jgi:hypothetical protein
VSEGIEKSPPVVVLLHSNHILSEQDGSKKQLRLWLEPEVIRNPTVGFKISRGRDVFESRNIPSF